MEFYGLVLGALCVWRVTHLLNAEDGPWDLLVRLRRRVGEGFWGGLLDCFYCLSLWIAAPFAWLLGGGVRERLLLWPALSAAAILLERITNRKAGPAPVYYSEDEENDDVLRQQEESIQHPGREPESPEPEAG
jgi:hypothetical protein